VGRKTSKDEGASGGLMSRSRDAAEGRGGLRSLRIVAGQWRGRRIPFVAVPGLRPTPDRVRETLFNWLQRDVVGARCLDLYAGTGALGFEALSRGAASSTFVERDPIAARTLGDVAQLLNTAAARVLRTDALHYLATPAEPYDLVFLDPPFALGALNELCTLLETRGWLAPIAWIYLEQAAGDALPALPANWRMIKDTRAGEVRALLARRVGGTT
jgi:16S rRNA (guanine966-N2)-methyltransferase